MGYFIRFSLSLFLFIYLFFAVVWFSENNINTTVIQINKFLQNGRLVHASHGKLERVTQSIIIEYYFVSTTGRSPLSGHELPWLINDGVPIILLVNQFIYYAFRRRVCHLQQIFRNINKF